MNCYMRGIIRDSPISRDCPMGTPNRNALPIAQSGSRLGNRSYCHVGGSSPTIAKPCRHCLASGLSSLSCTGSTAATYRRNGIIGLADIWDSGLQILCLLYPYQYSFRPRTTNFPSSTTVLSVSWLKLLLKIIILTSKQFPLVTTQ
jgi:hypothetical protein